MDIRPDLELNFNKVFTAPRRSSFSGEGFTLEHVRIENSGGFDYRVNGHCHYLALHDIVLEDGEICMDMVAPNANRDLRKTLTFTPRGCAVSGWSRSAARCNSFTALYFDPVMFSEDLGRRFQTVDPSPFLYRRDARLKATLTKVRDQLLGGEPDARDIEMLCMTACLEALGLVHTDAPAGLSSKHLKSILDYIDGQLGSPLSVAELAGIATLSKFHFVRASRRRRVAPLTNMFSPGAWIVPVNCCARRL